MKRAAFALCSVALAGLLAGCHSTDYQSTPDADALTDEQKFTLAYMWNEEKLAKDLYLALNEIWPQETLANIANKSETLHEAMVETLVEAYDINITNLDDYEQSYSEAELRTLAPGEFAIAQLQNLYDTLYAEGAASAQDALEAACKVEVTDINDLTAYIVVAEGADDLVSTFESLRSDSYMHYGKFDQALKAMDVTEGCCILGEAYCLN